jgi:hypothetical protein
MKTTFAAAALALAMIAVPAAAITLPAPAAITNLDFESGLAGWTSFGTTGTAASYGAFTAYGSALGYVEAGRKGVYSTLSQIFNLAAGDTVSGLVGFQANDYLPFNDDAFLKIGSFFARPTTLFTANVASVGDFGNSGWTSWSFTAPRDATYVLQLGVANRLDSGLASGAVLDVFAARPMLQPAAVPEPASWALMIAGFGMVGFALRRRATLATA